MVLQDIPGVPTRTRRRAAVLGNGREGVDRCQHCWRAKTKINVVEHRVRTFYLWITTN